MGRLPGVYAGRDANPLIRLLKTRGTSIVPLRPLEEA